jgi:hypothetical protein
MLSTKYPIYYFRSSSGAVRTSTNRYFKTGKPGCPDISLIYNGLYYGLELKSDTGRQSPAQRQAQVEIEAAGGRYVIVKCLGDVKKLFE